MLTAHPVNSLLLTDAIARQIAQDNEAEGQRPKAFETMWRASDAGKCARVLGLRESGYAPTEPVDLAGQWVMWLGVMIHEKMGHALIERFGFDAVTEHPWRLEDLVSGHLDAKVTMPNGEIVCYELKTRNAFGFDKAIGLNRMKYSEKPPEGPRSSDLIQGALNAHAIGADRLVIGIIGLEAVSKGLAEKLGYDDLRRIMAEWHYTREDFEPIALAELDRMREMKAWMDDNLLPPRWAIDEVNGALQSVTLNPDQRDVPWQCQYCDYRSLCTFAGVGPVSLPIPGMRESLNV